MQFLIDAALPRSVADVLAEGGHDALHVEDAGIAHETDDAIATFARQHGYTIITADFDFADIRVFPPAAHHGIVVLTLPKRRDLLLIVLLVREFLAAMKDVESLEGKLVIVELGRIRVRE
ncbi:MAG TPA: DUF5615 family PIN-like protein [Thermoanaerobaculia bacterium]|nr:DUF5615 family PIN-like protein [Thermoanaerobaculia bacterium]